MLEGLGGDAGAFKSFGHGDEAFGFAGVHGGVDDAEFAVFSAKVFYVVSFFFWNCHRGDYMALKKVCKGRKK